MLSEKNLSLQKTDEICRAHETTIEQMKVVGGSSTGDTDSGDVNAFSKKPKGGKKGVVDSLEAMTPEEKRVVIAGVGMMCQSVKTVQHLEKGVTSVTSKTISRTCVLDQCLNRRSEEIESIIWRMNFQTKFSAWSDDSQLVTLKLESGNYLRFQPDTGARCNVVPLHLYKKATRHFNLLNVTPVSTAIISYGGTSIPILGRVRLRVWRGDFRCFLDCNLVDSKRVRPILGRKA